jgi:hypothetical protein
VSEVPGRRQDLQLQQTAGVQRHLLSAGREHRGLQGLDRHLPRLSWQWAAKGALNGAGQTRPSSLGGIMDLAPELERMPAGAFELP